jgi:SpoVK/Ycf46/Vps4 family AAA+-type ATPase
VKGMKEEKEAEEVKEAEDARDVEEEGNTNVSLSSVPMELINTININDLDEMLKFIEIIKQLKVSVPKYQRLIGAETVIRDLNCMIGLNKVKSSLVHHIFAMAKQKDPDDSYEPCFNTKIYGAPGCGKSTLAHFIAMIYQKFGLSNGKIIRGNRANMIGEHVGETAPRTLALLKSALGGVLFIDEFYQFGHKKDGNRCPFAYESIVTIVEFITDNPGFKMIVAGYQTDIENNVLEQNEGLASRLPHTYIIEPPTAKELDLIFKAQASKRKFTIDDSIITEFTSELFPASGRDTQFLFDSCERAHIRRGFQTSTNIDKIITKADWDSGIAYYKEQHTKKPINTSMYT